MTYQRNVPEYTREEALALGHTTFILGPSQISVQDMPDDPDNSVYLLNWITDPEERGKGHAGALLRSVLAVADLGVVKMYTHPDTPELRETMGRFGFQVDYDGPTWEDKPLLVRHPQPKMQPFYRYWRPEMDVRNA